MHNYNTSKEANALGGIRAASTPYYCHTCGNVGFGQRYVQSHLTNGCTGASYKTRKLQPKYRQYYEEAVFNTDLWHRNKQLKETTDAYRLAYQQAIQDIEAIKSLRNGQTQMY